MMIRKSKICLAYIEALINCWGWLIVGDLENGGQAAAEYVGQLFEVS